MVFRPEQCPLKTCEYCGYCLGTIRVQIKLRLPAKQESDDLERDGAKNMAKETVIGDVEPDSMIKCKLSLPVCALPLARKGHGARVIQKVMEKTWEDVISPDIDCHLRIPCDVAMTMRRPFMITKTLIGAG